jgi:hypothetical protein
MSIARPRAQKKSETNPSPKSTKKSVVAIAAAKVQQLNELLTAAQKGLQIAIADT